MTRRPYSEKATQFQSPFWKTHVWKTWEVAIAATAVALAAAGVILQSRAQSGSEDRDAGIVPLAVLARDPGPQRESALVELGRRLFFDPGASHSRNVSCSSCHLPEAGFSDPRPSSRDDFGSTPRHSQSVLNLTEYQPFHWDGQFANLEALVTARTGDSRVIGGGYNAQNGERVQKMTPVAETIAQAGLYAHAFEAAFGDPKATPERFSTAVAAYVRTLKSSTSPFDRFLKGDGKALSDAAQRGYELFRGRAGCANCHTATGERPAFTDGKFHNTGRAALHDQPKGQPQALPAGQEPRLTARDGRRAVTKRPEDAHGFKTPSLRDVALRAPAYMHDGSLASLSAVVRYYAVECGNVTGETLDPLLKPFGADRPVEETNRDITDLVAFLSALTGETRAGLGSTGWDQRAKEMRLKLVDAQGQPYRGVVALAPGGDDLTSPTPTSVGPLNLIPDEEGIIQLKPFAATHVKVTVPGSDLAFSGGLVPDTCRDATLRLDPVANRQLRRMVK